jgi:hypothetical protein
VIAGASACLPRTGVYICPTLVAMDRWMPMSEADVLLSRPHMRTLPPSLVDRWRGWNEREYLSDWTRDVHAKGKHARRLITNIYTRVLCRFCSERMPGLTRSNPSRISTN